MTRGIVPSLRVLYKRLRSRFALVPAFCKSCGRDVHDYVAPPETWDAVEPTIPGGAVLCYDCFCERCGALGLPEVWALVRHD